MPLFVASRSEGATIGAGLTFEPLPNEQFPKQDDTMDEDSQSKGPFDRILHSEPGEPSDRTVLYVVAGLVVVVAILLVLVFPLAVFDDDDNEQTSNVSVSPSRGRSAAA